MDTRKFLETVLSGDGYYCVFGAKQNSDRRIQKFFPDLDGVVEVATDLVNEGYDAYYALATYETSGSRKGDNAKQLKSFFLDIDCGEGKDYPDQPSGIAALKQFCATTKLPRPTLVNSGRGVHVYWSLVSPIDAQLWIPVAERLKALCRKHGFNADPNVTADVARILRIPNTLNFKDDPASEVAVLSSIGTPIEFEDFRSLMGDIPVPNKLPFTPRAMDDVTNALAGNYSNLFKTIMLKTMSGRGCAQLQKVVEEQETLSEPMWRAGLSIAKFCIDGEKAIHKISSRHPDYHPDTTLAKASLIKGPYTCDKFDEYSPNVCKDCKHRGKFKSPIVLGREVQEADESDNVVEDIPKSAEAVAQKQTYVIPKYPEPFFRGKAGGIFKRAKDKEGDPIEIPIYHNDFYVTRRLNDPDMGESIGFRLHLPKDGVREFTIPLASVLSKDEFRKYMANAGVAVIKMEDLMQYTTAWVNKLQATSTADQAHKQFGWVDDMASFIVGEKEICADRVNYNPPSNATMKMMSAFSSKGTLEDWKNMIDFYNRPSMEMHQFVIGMGFGSPFMQFTPFAACMFHMYSEDPGLGKTTILQAASTIWGDPEQILLREGDTNATKFNRAEIYKNILLPVDENTNIHPKDASDFLYQSTGGLQRNRMSNKSNEERSRGKSWHNLIASNGNTSFLARVGMYKAVPKAEATRVLEYEAKAFVFSSKTETDELGIALMNNYGLACVPYMQYFIKNIDEMRTLFKETQAKVDQLANLSQPHRYWSVLITSTMCGLIVARRLGLIKFAVPFVMEFAIGVVEKAKITLDQMRGNPEDTLTNYLADNYNNILRIRSTDDARANTVLDHLIIPDATPRIALVARYEYDAKKMYLLPKPLKEWCSKQQINYLGFIEGLKKGRTLAINKKVRMGKGTNMNLPATDVWMLDCSEFMNEEVEQTIASASVSNSIAKTE